MFKFTVRFAQVMLLIAAAVGVIGADIARAATSYTWMPTVAGTYNWDDNVSNWTTGFPSVTGDTANLTANLAGAQTVNLNQAITVGTLNIGDPASPFSAYTITPNGGTLTFDNGSGRNVALTTTNVATAVTNSITAPITLRGKLFATIQSTNALSISGLIGESGGSFGLQSGGASTLTLNSASANTYTGGTTVTSGFLTVNSTSSLGSNTAGNNVLVSNDGRLTLNAAGNIGSSQGISFGPPQVTTFALTNGTLPSVALNYDGLAGGTAVSGNSGVVLLNVAPWTTALDESKLGNASIGSLQAGSNGAGILYNAATLGAGSDNVYRLGAGGQPLTITNGVLTGANSFVVGTQGFNGSAAANGTGNVILKGSNNYTGSTTINPGQTLILQNGSGAITSSSGISVVRSTLSLENFPAFGNSGSNSNNRIGDSIGITLNRGTFTTSGGLNVNTTEAFGTLTLVNNAVVTMTLNGAINTLTPAALSRTGTAVMLIRGNDLGINAKTTTYNKFTLGSTTGLSAVGTNTAATSNGQGSVTNLAIVPWLIAENNVNNAGLSFATYDVGVDGIAGNADDVGIRPLSANETLTFATATGTDANIKDTGTALTVPAVTTINSLMLAPASAGTVTGSGTLNVTSGALGLFTNANETISGYTAINLGTTEAILVNSNGSTLIISCPINPGLNIGLVKHAIGIVTLTGSNTFTGPITVNTGTLNLNGSGTQSSTTVTGGTLAVGINSAGAWGSSSAAVNVKVAGILAVDNAAAGNITLGGGNINLDDGGIISLTGGGGGRLEFVNRVVCAGNGFIKQDSGAGSGNKTYIGPITLSAGSILTLLRNNSSINDFGVGIVTLNGNATINTASNVVDADHPTGIAKITGSSGITKKGAGELWLGYSGFNNATNTAAVSDYTGDTSIEQGNLRMGIVNGLPSTTTVAVNFGARFDMSTGNTNDTRASFSQNVAGLNDGSSGGGTVTANGTTLSGLAATLSLNGISTYSFSGVISNNAGSGTATLTLAKTGSGTQTLSGTSTYTGPTTVSAGRLVVNGSLGATAVTVNGNAVATPPPANATQLRGTGTLGGTVTVAKSVSTTGDAVLWPGTSDGVAQLTSAAEKLTVTGTIVTLTSGGKLVTVMSSNGGTGRNQQLVIKNAAPVLNIDNTSLLSIAADKASDLFNAAPNGDYVIVDILDASGAANPIMFTAFSLANISSGSLAISSNTAGTAGPNASIIYRNNGVDSVNQDGGAVTANQIVIRFSGSSNVTPVKIEALSAVLEGAGVNVSWTSISEFKNAGFNIYRRALGESKWVRANPALIAGRVTNPDEKKYSFYDWAPAGTFDYKLESVGIMDDREFFLPDTQPVTVDLNLPLTSAMYITTCTIDAAEFSTALSASVKSASQIDAGTMGAVSPPVSVKVIDMIGEQKVANSPGADVVVRSAPASSEVSPVLAARWFSSGGFSMGATFTGAKVEYTLPGVMLIPLASLPNGLDIHHLAVQREGVSIPALAVTPNGLVVFGQGYEDDYTNRDALFLRSIGGTTAAGQVTHAQGLFASTETANVQSPASVSTSYHDVYFDYNSAFRPFTFAPWFSGKYLTADGTSGTAQRFTITTPFASGSAATLTVNAWSLTQSESASPDHALQVVVNGIATGQVTWTGGNKMVQLTFQIPPGALQAGDNAIDLITPAITGVDNQIAFLHSLECAYTRQLDASNPIRVNTTGTSSQLYELNNLPSADAWVVDARFPARTVLVPYESADQGNGTFNIRFRAGVGGTGQYLVVPVGMENAPLSVTRRQVKPVRSTAVYLATGPNQFSSGVQPLLAQRAKDGMRSQYVDQNEIFDYYNYGRYGPMGIQKAIQATRPQYVLLLGRTTYDYKNYGGLNIDPLCPAFLVSTSFWAQSTSDSQFGDMGRGYPEVAVGRLPVNNATELSGAVRHILNYKGPQSSGIRVHAAADRDDPAAGMFGAEADTIAEANPELAWQRNYLGATYQTAPEVNAALTAAANGGADWVLYAGHGNAARLGAADPRILDQTSVQAWTGNTVFLQSTCTGNWMAKNEAEYKSIAIQALTQPQGGISASIGTSTYMNSDHAVKFMAQLLLNATGGGKMRWGDALKLTQQWAYKQDGGNTGFYFDLSRTEQLFGDPAMPLFSTPVVLPNGKGAANGQQSGNF